jgi:hypothetical protein
VQLAVLRNTRFASLDYIKEPDARVAMCGRLANRFERVFDSSHANMTFSALRGRPFDHDDR